MHRGIIVPMIAPKRESGSLSEIIIALMICSGFLVTLCALPLGLLWGTAIGEGWGLRLQVVAAVTVTIAAAGGALFGFGSVLNKLWLRRHGGQVDRENDDGSNQSPMNMPGR